jgi:phage shock protein E
MSDTRPQHGHRLETTGVRTAHSHHTEGRALLLDVRTREEYEGGHAPGALCVPLQELAASLGALADDRPICVICRSGHRSSIAAQHLRDAGRGPVANVDGGRWPGRRPGCQSNGQPGRTARSGRC